MRVDGNDSNIIKHVRACVPDGEPLNTGSIRLGDDDATMEETVDDSRLPVFTDQREIVRGDQQTFTIRPMIDKDRVSCS